MSVGLAIFLGSVVLALVNLYGITKDRWRWRNIAKICALAVVTPVVLTAAAIGGLYVWSRLPSTIYPPTEYAGLRLGISPDEVLYIKGYPPEVLGAALKAEEDGVWAGLQPLIMTDSLKKGERVEDYKDWIYPDGFNHIDIAFNGEKTALVSIKCYSPDSRRRCPPISGVAIGDSEQNVVRKLGPPGTSRIDGITKVISYPNVGIELYLSEKDGVYMLGINNRSATAAMLQ
jgi:hypothetical protein